MDNSMESLLKSEEGSDVIVKVGARSFHLHALILKTRSPYFKGALTSGQSMTESDGIVQLDDSVCENAFVAILHFIYCSRVGPLDALSHEDLFNLFELANYLQLIDFKAYIGRQALNHDESKSPFQLLKECIKKNVEQVEQDQQRAWLVAECQRAAQTPSPDATLKNALLEVLCEDCRAAQHYESAYMCLTLFHSGGEPGVQDLEEISGHRPNTTRHSDLAKVDLLWVRSIVEKVYTLRMAPPQSEPPLVQLSLKPENKALKAKLSEAVSLKAENESLKSTLSSKCEELQALVQNS